MSDVTPDGPGLRCALCDRPAIGHAFIGDLRYCHGDDDPEPTCYEQGQWDIAHGSLDGLTVPFGPDGSLPGRPATT